MRRLLLILLFLNIFLSSTAFSSEQSQLLSPEQAMKLVDAVWQLPPESMDIAYYQSIRDSRRSEKELRRSFETAFYKARGLKEESLTPGEIEARDRVVEINVQTNLKQRIVGRKSRRRLRFDKNRLRMDFSHDNMPEIKIRRGQKEEVFPARNISREAPYATTIIQIPDKDSGFLQYNYFHAQKNTLLRKMKNKGTRPRNEFSRFKMMPDFCVLFLRKALGDLKDGIYDPNETKINNLRLGTLDNLAISIQSGKTSTRDQLEIIQRDRENKPAYRHKLIVDKEDYSKVYYYEVQNMITGVPLLIRDIKEFDSQGFPSKVTTTLYGADGNIQSEEEYTFVDVKIDISIPDVAFDVDKIDK